MNLVTWPMGLGEEFYFFLKELGSYGRLSHRSDSLGFMSCLLISLSCLKAVLFLYVPSSEERYIAMSSGAPG